MLDDSGLIDPAKAWAVMMRNEKPGGHGERSVAVGVLDMALWDARAKAEGLPLRRLLANKYRNGEADPHAWVYAAGGYYYPGKGLDALQDEMRHYQDLGYSCVKMKIGGVPLAEDLERIEAVLKIVGAGENLAVDANGRFTPDEAAAYADALAPYKLRWYEEPLDPLDYQGHAALAERYAPPLATGENLFSVHDARNLIRHGGLRSDRDILQFDPALSYGLVEYLRTLDMLKRHGWSCAPLRTAWRPPIRAQHRGRARSRRQRDPTPTSSPRSAGSPTTVRSRTASSACPTFPVSVSRPRRRFTRSCARSPRIEAEPACLFSPTLPRARPASDL